MDTRATRRAAFLAVAIVIGAAGMLIGMAAFGRMRTTMGPFDVELAGHLGRSVTEISLPPLGRITASTHKGPLAFQATLKAVDIKGLTALVRNRSVADAADLVAERARKLVVPFALRLLLLSVLSAAALAAVAFRTKWRGIVVSAAVPLIVVGGSEVAAWATYDSAAFTAPKFSGPLALAPKLVGDVETAAARIDAFRLELQRIVSGAIRVYGEIQSRGVGQDNLVRVLHISDVHVSPLGLSFARDLAQAFDVDVVLDTGDLTSFGTPVEDLITRFVPGFRRPYIFVPGNHDGPSLKAAMTNVPNVTLLNGTTAQRAGITFYGLAHPVFTPNKQALVDDEEFEARARAAGQRVLSDIEAMPAPPDVVAVHDDRMAESVAGRVPLVVSGHFHQASARVLNGTLYLRDGTTGGAGFTVFTQTGGIPLSAEILYFSPGPPATLVAFDRITQSPETGNLSVERHLVAQEFGALIPEAPASPSGAN
ncbi:MAG TPA: metallophosphoesterase [Actinomycetota bacterium]